MSLRGQEGGSGLELGELQKQYRAVVKSRAGPQTSRVTWTPLWALVSSS